MLDMLGLNLATAVLILGIFFVVLGVVIAGVVYRESREWKKLILPMFDREPVEMNSPTPREEGGLTPRMASFGKEIFGRLFSHMDVAGLLGGAAIVILGIIIVLIGLSI